LGRTGATERTLAPPVTVERLQLPRNFVETQSRNQSAASSPPTPWNDREMGRAADAEKWFGITPEAVGKQKGAAENIVAFPARNGGVTVQKAD
jgi:hypothetical protein